MYEIQAITNLLRSPSTTAKQLRQIHAHLLRRIPFLPISLFNSILSAYAGSALTADAFALFASQPPRQPDKVTFHYLLKPCSRLKSVLKTTQVHSLSFKFGFGKYTLIQNGFLLCYCACGRLDEARKLFDEMPYRDTASYNTMIRGYTENADMGSAAQLFEEVQNPNEITWTTMITGYANNGNISAAERLFHIMPDRDLVSWNAMLSGYIQNREPSEALHLFRELLFENAKPNRVTITSTLAACADLGALGAGRWMHVYINKNNFRLDPYLGCALIDMYAKCGVVEFSLHVFQKLKVQNTCTWNAIINGFAMNGLANQALELFGQMQLDASVRPDEITFVGVFLACSHGGFLEEGKRHFNTTVKKHGIRLILEHYACMVDLLGRSGLLSEAEELVRSMPITPDDVVWRALLGGCRIHRDVELAERVVSEIKEHGSGDYVLLSNLYAAVGRWHDSEKIRKLMKSKRIEKIPGSSLIEINNTIHEFISGDKTDSWYEETRAMQDEVGKKMSQEGYVAEKKEVFYDIDEEEKDTALEHHSEKLAIAFGLLNTPHGTTLRIVKNLRFCTDCHSAAKYISKIYAREIIVRDRLRFHHMKDGKCSCKDFW